MSSIGDRLREERERLGFNQTAFGAIGGVQKQAQLKYEKGERFPDAAYLSTVNKVGADVQYIVTGIRSAAALSDDEQELVSDFRAATLEVKAATLAGLKAGSKGAKFVVHGSVGQQNSGQTGGVFVVNMGKDTKPTHE